MQRLIIALFILALPALASAQGNRAGAWEWSVAAIYQDSASSGAEPEVNSRMCAQVSRLRP